MTYLTGTKLACEAYAATAAKAIGLPRRGVHHGGGRHVDLDGPLRLGWTLAWDVPRKHPKKEQWAVAVLPTFEAKGLDTKGIETLAAAEISAKELPPNWSNDGIGIVEAPIAKP